MEKYCVTCQKYVIAEKFKRILDIKKKIIEEEFYCPYCLQTIFIKNLDEEKE